MVLPLTPCRIWKEVGFAAEDSLGKTTYQIDRNDGKQWRDEESHRIARDRHEVSSLFT